MPKETPRAFERVLLSRWFLLSLLAAAVIIAISYARAYYQDYKVRQQIAALETEVLNLQRKKLVSLDLLKQAGTEQFLEDKAKTELNLKKPGEQVLVIPNIKPETPQTVVATTTTAVDEPVLSNPRKWWYYFTKSNY